MLGFGCSCSMNVLLLVILLGPVVDVHSQTVPGQPSVSVNSTTATTISLSWSVPSGSVVTSYVVMWQRDTSVCSGDDDGSMSVTTTSVSTSRTITVQEEDSSYNITVTATNAAGSSAPTIAITAVTGEAAPSAAPTSMNISEVTSSSIIVQWGAVDCIHRNGDITGYSVRYGVQGSGSTQTVSVSGGGATMTTIYGLTHSTTYSIEVAAVNSAGTGEYSPVIIKETADPDVFISFMGEILPNHGYVNLSLVGTAIDGSDSVQCHTDLSSCCSGAQGADRGDWYFPSGDRLQFPSNQGDIYEIRRSQQVDIRRRNNGDTSGIYCCAIETNAARSDNITDITTRETVYVGLYSSGGDVTIPGGVTLTVNSDLNGASPQFTLTCISNGGPATTVTWTRDSATAMGDAVTVLDNVETATYTHILTVTGRLGGDYQCNVSNSKSSSRSASFIVQVASAPSDLMAVQNGFTSVRVSWSPPTPLRDTIGYRISYSGGSSGSVNVSDGSTDNYLLTDIETNTSLSISIAGTSDHLPSQSLSTELVVLSAPENFQIRLSGLIECSEWVVYSNAEKLEEIKNTVVHELSNSCQCQITADNIDQEQLVCFVSSNYVIYQARIIGILEKDSVFLTSLIEDWASSGPSIRVQGMLLGLGEDCTSDISAGVCSAFGAQTDTSENINIAAIVGAVVAVAAVLIIAAIAVATLLILRRRRGKFSLQKAEEYDVYTTPMTCATRLDITTNTNEAYNLLTRGGGRQGVQPRSVLSQQVGRSHKDSYEVPVPPLLQSRQGQRTARAVAGAASRGGEEGKRGTEEEVVYEPLPGDK